MRILVAIDSLRKQMDRNVAMAERAVQGGVNDATLSLKATLRGQVASAGLGNRLANTWRSNVKPKRPALDADGMVWTKAPHIMRTHAFGATIRAKNGRFLAVPTKEAGAGRRGSRLTPASWERRTGRKLIFVPARGSRPALLITDAATGSFTKRGAARTSRAATPRSASSVVVFILRPQVTLRKRLNVEGAANAAVASIPSRIAHRWQQ